MRQPARLPETCVLGTSRPITRQTSADRDAVEQAPCPAIGGSGPPVVGRAVSGRLLAPSRDVPHAAVAFLLFLSIKKEQNEPGSAMLRPIRLSRRRSFQRWRTNSPQPRLAQPPGLVCDFDVRGGPACCRSAAGQGEQRFRVLARSRRRSPQARFPPAGRREMRRPVRPAPVRERAAPVPSEPVMRGLSQPTHVTQTVALRGTPRTAPAATSCRTQHAMRTGTRSQ